jgi:hypothetical protein
MVALQENTREWYQEIVKLGHLIEAWGGDPARDLPPEEILESLRRLAIIVPIAKPTS